MFGQKTLLTTQPSKLSLADAGLGLGMGLVVPLIAEKALPSISANATVAQYKRQISGAVGVVLSIPLFWWRGLAPALLGAALGVAYAVSPYVVSWVNGIGSGSSGSELPASTSLGALVSPRTRSRRRASMGALVSPQRSMPSRSVAVDGVIG